MYMNYTQSMTLVDVKREINYNNFRYGSLKHVRTYLRTPFSAITPNECAVS